MSPPRGEGQRGGARLGYPAPPPPAPSREQCHAPLPRLLPALIETQEASHGGRQRMKKKQVCTALGEEDPCFHSPAEPSCPVAGKLGKLCWPS